MSKIYSYLISIFIIAGLSSCKSTHSIQTQPQFSEPMVLLPETDIPNPSADFQFFCPTPELKKAVVPRKDITENFSEREKQDIAVPDPKLLADENSMIVDLSLLSKEDYAFPLPGAKVISPYGGRRKYHSGVDLKTRANDTIVAAFEGIVRMAKPYAAYGKVIVIRHFNGLETIYSHNSKNLIKVGDYVQVGQPIALTGRTGRASTEHLHFEVRVNGQHFNPNIIFNLENRQLNDKCLVFTKTGKKIDVKSLLVPPYQPEKDLSYFIPKNIR